MGTGTDFSEAGYRRNGKPFRYFPGFDSDREMNSKARAGSRCYFARASISAFVILS